MSAHFQGFCRVIQGVIRRESDIKWRLLLISNICGAYFSNLLLGSRSWVNISRSQQCRNVIGISRMLFSRDLYFALVALISPCPVLFCHDLTIRVMERWLWCIRAASIGNVHVASFFRIFPFMRFASCGWSFAIPVFPSFSPISCGVSVVVDSSHGSFPSASLSFACDLTALCHGVYSKCGKY